MASDATDSDISPNGLADIVALVACGRLVGLMSVMVTFADKQTLIRDRRYCR